MEIISNFKRTELPEKLTEDVINDACIFILEDNGSYDKDNIDIQCKELLGRSPVTSYQILFEEREGSLVSKSIRVNEQVEGDFFAHSWFMLEDSTFRPIGDVDIKSFKLCMGEEYKSHITMFMLNGKRKLFWDLYINEKHYTNLDRASLIKSKFIDKKEFLEFIKDAYGLKTTSRTLNNYRNLSLFPEPESIVENGITKTYYNHEWAKYLLFIEDYKQKQGETWSIQDIRKKNEYFFKAIPMKKGKKRKKR